MVDDTKDDTISPPAANDTEPPPPLIPRGFAQHAMMAAISDVYRAVELLTATADAIARQLDAQEEPQ